MQVHIDQIFKAIDTLADAIYVDAYNMLVGRLLQIAMGDTVNVLEAVPEKPE